MYIVRQIIFHAGPSSADIIVLHRNEGGPLSTNLYQDFVMIFELARMPRNVMQILWSDFTYSIQHAALKVNILGCLPSPQPELTMDGWRGISNQPFVFDMGNNLCLHLTDGWEDVWVQRIWDAVMPKGGNDAFAPPSPWGTNFFSMSSLGKSGC